jgi:hypothetical protein
LELEAPSGFEPEMEVLQTSALPLGDGADLKLAGGTRTNCGLASADDHQRRQRNPKDDGGNI